MKGLCIRWRGRRNGWGGYSKLREKITKNWEKKEIQYIHKFRVAGACFILAEAYCKDGKEHDAQAIEVMNNYLAQRRATLVDTQLTGDQLLKAILPRRNGKNLQAKENAILI